MSERSELLGANTALAAYKADVAESATYLKPADAASCKQGFHELVGDNFANEARKLSATKSLAALFRQNNAELLGDIRIADMKGETPQSPSTTPSAPGRGGRSQG